MKCYYLFLLVFVFSSCKFFRIPDEKPPKELSLQEQLSGSWHLSAFYGKDSRGNTVYPLGESVIGYMNLLNDNKMTLQVLNTERPLLSSSDPYYAPNNEIRMAYLNYYAYFGSYEIDSLNHVMTIIIQGSHNPNWEGTMQKRSFQLNNDTLILISPPMSFVGATISNRMIWVKDADTGSAMK